MLIHEVTLPAVGEAWFPLPVGVPQFVRVMHQNMAMSAMTTLNFQLRPPSSSWARMPSRTHRVR